ncbi:MAG: response regulator [Desulfatiglans sp.]|jgi:two-component system phosphate regulon response regulator OmpR|nr:response regulator [Desulfatiglans sp.]
MAGRVLIIEDDAKIRMLLKEYLEGNGFEVITLSDGNNALDSINSESPDIVILDIMLPGKNGLEVLKEIRQKNSIPIIMLTAKGEDADRIVGLELGADDYLPKPFNPRELLARMRAVMRRIFQEKEADTDPENLVMAGGIVLNRAKQTAKLEGEEIELSSTEYKILEVLMTNPNVILNRDQIMNYARGRDFMAFDRSIDVHISKLRSKLDKSPRSPRRIKTIWGSGYMFVDQK